ncbi:F-box only protein 7 isoform X1 [Gasterosteus aculeatus]
MSLAAQEAVVLPSMKLRVRINRHTSRVEVPGEAAGLKELTDIVRETILSSQGLSADSHFSLSLNGSTLLTDSGQTLSSCGIVSGDLICVVLPESTAESDGSTAARTTGDSDNQNQQVQQVQQVQQAAMTSNQSSSSRLAPTVPGPERTGPPPPRWEPMLCSEAEDGRAPASLELLLHSAQTSSPSDAVVVAGHLLMLETGFVPQAGELKASEMPAGWRSPGVYKLQYTHPLCEGSGALVVSVCMGAVLVINATLKVNETVDAVRKLCVNPSSYVTDQQPGKGAAAIYRDLRKLSRVFKDQLAYPLIAAARDAVALPVLFGLAALPPELVLRVLRLLDVRSVVRLSAVCRRFAVSTADSSLWRHLYRRDFSDGDLSRSRDTDWKELYKRFHKIRCERRQVTWPRPLPPFHRNPFVPAPLQPPLPGIIGGDYDQNPGLPRVLLPRPRYDPVGPPGLDRRLPRGRPMGGRAADIRRGFI